MDKRFSALEGDLESIKTVVDRRLQVLEELVAELRSLRSDLQSRDESLKEELLREMGTPVHVGPETLRPRATLFRSSRGMVGEGEGGTERNDSETLAGGGHTNYGREGYRAGVAGYGCAVEGDVNVSGTQAAAQELQSGGER